MFTRSRRSSRYQELKAKRRAAEKGDHEAAYALGLAYLRGEGVLPSLPIAARWLTQAARLGHADAQFQLSWVLMQDDSSAPPSKRWFIAANAASSEVAERNRALLFPDGIALVRDPVAACRWAKAAAEVGHSEAQAQLAYS